MRKKKIFFIRYKEEASVIIAFLAILIIAFLFFISPREIYNHAVAIDKDFNSHYVKSIPIEDNISNDTSPCEYQINDFDGRLVSVGCREECGCHVIREINVVCDLDNCSELNYVIDEIKNDSNL